MFSTIMSEYYFGKGQNKWRVIPVYIEISQHSIIRGESTALFWASQLLPHLTREQTHSEKFAFIYLLLFYFKTFN